MVGRILAGPVSRPWNNEGAPEATTSVAALVHIGTNRPIEFVDLTPRVKAFVLTAGLVTGWILDSGVYSQAEVGAGALLSLDAEPVTQ